MSTPSRGRERFAAVVVFCVGLLTALLFTFVIYPHQQTIHQVLDLNHFGQIGINLYEGKGFSLGDGPTIRRGPLYPGIVALVFEIFGYRNQSSYLPVFLLQCLFNGLTCLLAYAIAKRLFGYPTAMLAGLLCSITPVVLRYVPEIEVEATMTLLITAMTYTAVRCYQDKSVLWGCLLGIATGLASLTKAVALFYPFVFIGLLWWNWKHNKSEWGSSSVRKIIIALLIGLGLTISPWFIRNEIVTHGEFHGISSNASGEFIRSFINVEPKFVFLQTPFGHGNWDWQANMFENGLLKKHGMEFIARKNGRYVLVPMNLKMELKKELLENHIALELVMKHPLWFLWKEFIQIFTFWYVVETPKKSIIVGCIALFCLGFGWYGIMAARRQQIPVEPVVSLVLYFNGIYALILSFARYSMPVYPSLLPLTAYGLYWAFVGRKRMRFAAHRAEPAPRPMEAVSP
ncbi:MAG: glycosyltransferase family 39 protein [Armatimonadetes bacterium]|nr:glycosyltransferase family 39 protein [Armatimonadota bacterium]